MACVDCDESGNERGSGPTIVVGGTTPKPPASVAASQARAMTPAQPLMVNAGGETEINPKAFPDGTPPMLLELLNQVRSLRIELAACMAVMEKRGLITATELQEARVAVHQAVQQAFQHQQAQIGRDFAQRPTAVPARGRP